MNRLQVNTILVIFASIIVCLRKSKSKKWKERFGKENDAQESEEWFDADKNFVLYKFHFKN